ncbi:hypothetical protein [Humibacter ginsengisoli]
MSVDPGYGETPLEPEESDALTERARSIFGDQATKIELYEAEQAINDEVSLARLVEVAAGDLSLGELLTDGFLRDLHTVISGRGPDATGHGI